MHMRNHQGSCDCFPEWKEVRERKKKKKEKKCMLFPAYKILFMKQTDSEISVSVILCCC